MPTRNQPRHRLALRGRLGRKPPQPLQAPATTRLGTDLGRSEVAGEAVVPQSFEQTFQLAAENGRVVDMVPTPASTNPVDRFRQLLRLGRNRDATVKMTVADKDIVLDTGVATVAA